MTTVEIESYDDFRGDAVASSAEKDRIIQVLRERESDAVSVFRADEWLWSDKGLACLPASETLIVASVVAETEKAWLLTQNSDVEDPDASDAQTDWVPKSVARQYAAGEDGVERDGQPQRFIGDYHD